MALRRRNPPSFWGTPQPIGTSDSSVAGCGCSRRTNHPVWFKYAPRPQLPYQKPRV